MTPSIRLAAGALLIIAAAARAGAAQAPGWPQASGPSGTWSAEAPDAPTRWSVARGEHIRWRTPLPNGGQGNLAVAAGRIFLATFPEYAGGPKEGNAILGHAVDQRTGRILWSVRLAGGRASPMMYAFSDSTSWTPICDGEHVWFFDSSGEMGCWDLDGKEVWRRAFRTQPERFPFNRQHEPFLAGDAIVTLEPIAPDEPGYRADRADWSFLRGIDKRTGRTLWIAEDGTTF
jgi:outer membrane protein assembly factor BamB